MSKHLRDRDPEKALAAEYLRHHGITVSEVALASLEHDETLDADVSTSATQMLEWLRKSPEWITSKTKR
jgi:hypothetical protein